MKELDRESVWLLTEKYKGVENEAYHRDLERLEAGEPLPYIIGDVPFIGTIIHLDSHPLIPRSETEYWVEQAILDMKKNTSHTLHVLDLCAGSGCIGVAVLSKVPNATVDFVELDPLHHATIAKNVRVQATPDSRYTILGGDLFENVTEQYDYILTNPPYIDKTAGTVSPNVAEHEPAEALYGGQQGLEIITQIIQRAQTFLSDAGQIWLEHEPTQSGAIAKLAESVGLYTETHRDQYSLERFTTITRNTT